jgi:hypothetical protein
MRAIRADEYVSALLHKGNSDLSNYLKSDVMIIHSPIDFGLDQLVRQEIGDLHAQEDDRLSRLSVLLKTGGGHVEVVERIYGVFRQHYSTVSFIVPDYAYSAGTVLVLSGDEIYMDYYSILGPIDPQIRSVDGRFVPGLGYLQKYEELTRKINEATDPAEVRAELSYLLAKFDPAELFLLEQARNHSASLLKAWLPKHKFKHWTKTKDRGIEVTKAMRERRAEEIAMILGNPERWHSHGRGIGIKELTSDEIKLDIVNFGEDPDLNQLIGSYYQLFTDYCDKLGSDMESSVVHTRNGMRLS